ncbi:MAG: hypothetical protein C4523_00940 [Myxococcales bacterium]|nr:MAG: hypothetical protein C4523_00940 [Myxococcales bacterium]
MKRLSDFIDRDSARYLGLDETLAAFSPVSDAGRRQAQRLMVYAPGEEAALRAHHERASTAVALIQNRPDSADRLLYHLRELPRIDDAWPLQWGQSEIALLVAFRYHHHRLRQELEGAPLLAQWLNLVAPADLDGGALGDPGSSRFYIDDRRNPALAEQRRRIKEAQAEIHREKTTQRQALCLRHGLPETADQWVVDREDQTLINRLMADPDVALVGETVASVRFAPRTGERLATLRSAYASLLQGERRIETGLYLEIEKALRPRSLIWMTQAQKLVELDLLLAVAKTALAWKAVAPRIDSDPAAPLTVAAGAHKPLEDVVRAEGAAYVPLDWEAAEPVAVLTGANMGGKTVVLQTLGWLQALVQLGFFVPAAQLRTRLYSRVAALGAQGETLGGLSGFGREIERLSKLLPFRRDGVLYLLDEPARTTHAREGRAIIRAVLEAIAASPSCGVVATHFDGLAGEGYAWMRMRGLRREVVAEWRSRGGEARPPLHHLMDYRVERADDADATRPDALRVAELLGLEGAIIARAQTLLDAD